MRADIHIGAACGASGSHGNGGILRHVKPNNWTARTSGVLENLIVDSGTGKIELTLNGQEQHYEVTSMRKRLGSYPKKRLSYC